MTKIIGLTGGIGSGKTSIANYFRTLGIPVYIADEEAAKIRNLPDTLHKIRNTFGEQVFTNEILDRVKLAELVFSDKLQLEKLNSIIHPAVKIHFNKWLKSHEDEPIVIREAAILFESGSYLDCDSIITVTAPEEMRIKRVMNRDAVSEDAVKNRMKNQWTDEQRIAKSNFVIKNENLSEAKKQAAKILKKLTIP